MTRRCHENKSVQVDVLFAETIFFNMSIDKTHIGRALVNSRAKTTVIISSNTRSRVWFRYCLPTNNFVEKLQCREATRSTPAGVEQCQSDKYHIYYEDMILLCIIIFNTRCYKNEDTLYKDHQTSNSRTFKT